LFKISGYSQNLTSINDVLALDQYITVECLQNGLKITVELNDLQQQTKIYEPIKLVTIGLNDSKICEMKVGENSQPEPISLLIPEICLSNNTTQKILMIAGNEIIHKFEFSCDQMWKNIIAAANLNGESVTINSSVQIGFDFNLIISSKHIPFRIIDCWTEQNNHRANILKNGIPERDSRSVPLCQLFNDANSFDDSIDPLNKYDNGQHSAIITNEMRKMWHIRLRLGWDALPDSRQKAFRQLLRTKPHLQWEAVPDLSFDTDDFLSPITIYPITIQCSVSPFSSKQSSAIVSFGPIGVFIPQFYFLEDALFPCCPMEATIAYANLLRHPIQKKFFCSKVSTSTALLVSLGAFAIAVCCTAITFSVRYKN
uniref:Phosphatidylinositol-glycan biosynthesis class X protein n=1 Tax=Elaeophora elaphi TaxID=1147741 RepID=A0A0R3RMT1_9BILA